MIAANVRNNGQSLVIETEEIKIRVEEVSSSQSARISPSSDVAAEAPPGIIA